MKTVPIRGSIGAMARRSLLMVLLVGLWMMATGCATPALWSKENRLAHFGPAEDPKLALFHSQKQGDILVLYDEKIFGRKSKHRRAYYLFANKTKSRPDFVSTRASRSLSPIPVRTDASEEPEATSGYSAVSTGRYEFVLYEDGREMGTYNLPDYTATKDKWGRILLTPLAVTADAALVALYLGAAAAGSGNGH